jgi:hypothetical protein
MALCSAGALALCLATRDDIPRLLGIGALGLLALSLVLFREYGGRLLFGLSSLAMLAIYAWSGTESVSLEVIVESEVVEAFAGQTAVSAVVPRGLTDDPGVAQPAAGPLSSPVRGRSGIAIAPGYPVEWSLDSGWPADFLETVALCLNSNLAAGVADLQVTDHTGKLFFGPGQFWEPRLPGEPPAVESDDLPAAGVYRLFGEPEWRDLRMSAELRNGGPPVTLLLRLDEQLDGLAVRAWPARRELSIHSVREGLLVEELAGGYQTLRKPPLAGFQSLLREVLRAWLVGMAVLAFGVLLAPIGRLVAGPGDWRSPGWVGVALAVVLALAGLLATAWIANDVLERIPHVQDSVAYLFQARTFALGRLAVPLPAVPEAFEHEFILMRNEAWFSKYPPGHALLLTFGVLADAPWLVSPFAAGLTLVLLYGLGRTLYGGGTGLVAAALLLFSPFFLFMSGSMMAHATGLLLATLGMLLAARCVTSESSWVAVMAGISLGWLTASRQLTGLAVTVPVVAWLLVRALQSGRSLGHLPLVALGWSWPMLGLLAYNRAMTGDPFLNPYELWWTFDRVGFGRDVGMHNGHDLGRGLWNTYANLTALESHLFGWPAYLTLAFAILPFATGRARAGDWLCGGVSLSLMLAYVAYWADGLMFGPRYFYEASGCLALLTARGAICAAEATSGKFRTLLRRRVPLHTAPLFALFLGGLIGGNLLLNLPLQVELHRGYNNVSGYRQALVRAADLRQAIVFVPTSEPFAWWDYGSVFSANDPLLQAEVIFARDLGPAVNQRTMAAYPDRAPYLLADGRLSRLR